MDWWQIVLIILLFIVVGILGGVLLGYLIITQVLKKPFFKKREAVLVVGEQLKPTVPDLLTEVETSRRITAAPDLPAEVETSRRITTVPDLPVEVETSREIATAPGLLAEVKINREIATLPWTGKLLPFQTHVWDTTRDELHILPANLREDLIQAYVDISLANGIVWLSTELGRRSHSLDENYMKLCTNIAASLDRIIPLLKQSGN